MEKWKLFELDCNAYLNKKYGNFFTHFGFSNSTISDIKYENNKKMFYIEVKMPSAQSGQFVLLPDYQNKKFIFSPNNKTKPNKSTDFIIAYMNKHFEKYAHVDSIGQNIDIDPKIFNEWITNTYKDKGVKFMITKGKDYIIFPINQYGNYFFITAKYRIKKSGSSKVPKSKQQEVLKKLTQMNINFELTDDFNIKSNNHLNKLKFQVDDSEYMFSYFKENIYHIRKLSNTRNANVIFSIELRKEQNPTDLENFVNSL